MHPRLHAAAFPDKTALIIADSGEFNKRNLEKAKYAVNPLEDGSLHKWQLLAFDISALTLEAVKPYGLGNKEALRCKNMWTLGLALWMFDRDRQPIIDWLKSKFAKAPVLADLLTRHCDENFGRISGDCGADCAADEWCRRCCDQEQ